MAFRRLYLEDLIEIRFIKSNEIGYAWATETLTRIGHRREKKIFQICYIYHKKDRYYLVHLNEIKNFDGENILVSERDIAERNRIIALLVEWNIIEVLLPHSTTYPMSSLEDIMIVPSKEKEDWELVPLHKFKRADGGWYRST